MNGSFRKIFISSTCFDLLDVRAELEQMLRELDLSPIMSDENTSEFKVSAETNSIQTCLANVRASDCVVVILSQRYGAKLSPLGEDVSATHLEYREARKNEIPVLFYVRDRLMGEHGTSRKNQNHVDQSFPWSGKDAIPLFEFIDEHKQLEGDKPNWLTSFKDTRDLKSALKKDLHLQSVQSRASRLFSGGEVSKHVIDALQRVGLGRAGMTIQMNDSTSVESWQTDVVQAVHQIFEGRADGIRTSWLRPRKNGDRFLLPCEAHSHGPLYPSHPKFYPGEGLAGSVWQTETAAMHAADVPHPSWVIRNQCTNAAYLAAPVGPFSGNGGVLSVGSDEGFSAGPMDLEVLKMFASILSLSAESSVSVIQPQLRVMP